MKYMTWLLAALFLVCMILPGGTALADGTVGGIVTSTAAPSSGVDVVALIWAFVNSPVGVTVIGGFLAIVLGKIFTAQPKAMLLFTQYRGAFFDAVRKAEEAIPDNTPNVAMARLDFALKLLRKLQPALESVGDVHLVPGLSDAHDSLKE